MNQYITEFYINSDKAFAEKTTEFTFRRSSFEVFRRLFLQADQWVSGEASGEARPLTTRSNVTFYGKFKGRNPIQAQFDVLQLPPQNSYPQIKAAK